MNLPKVLALVTLSVSCVANAQNLQNLEGDLAPHLSKPAIHQQALFDGQRFPNVVVGLDGTVVTTWGNNGVRSRSSLDGGKTWNAVVAIDEKGFQGGGVIVDETSGDVLAFIEAHHPPAELTMYRSKDNGKTWQAEATSVLPDSKGNVPSMHMNDHGITLRHGKHKGRLIRPTRWYAGKNHRDLWPEHYTNAMYSDNGGRTWQASEPFPENGTGEATLAELSDGRIYYNSRIHWDKRPNNTRRRSAISDDGGNTWKDWDIVEALPDGHQHRSYGCMGGLTRLAVAGRDILIFSNLDTPNAVRERITVWASLDGGKTWPAKRLVFDGKSGYSSMTSGRPGTPSEGWIYLHYEGGESKGSTIAKFNLAWILDGDDAGRKLLQNLRDGFK